MKRTRMPIEDVDYMLKNCEKDADMFFIESASRDTQHYKTPSEYTVSFNTPFTNVYGVEILDASIPTTMYNIDFFNNRLVYGHVIHKSSPQLDFESIVDELAYNKQYNELFEMKGVDAKHIFVMSATKFDATDLLVSNDPTNVLVLTRTEYPIADLQVHIQKMQDPDVYYFEWDTKTYRTTDPMVRHLIGKNKGYALTPEGALVVYETKYLMESEVRTLEPTNNVYSSGKLLQLTPDDSACRWEIAIYIRDIELETGNYDITTLMNYLNKRFTDEDQQYMRYVLQNSYIKAGAPSSSATDIAKQSIYKFANDKKPYKTGFFFDLEHSSCIQSLGFGKRCDLFQNPTYASYKIAYGKLALAYSVESETQNSMNTPGIVNLQGIRYILLRCKEIESHLYSSFAYSSQCPGIGMFKLSSGNNITHLRFDFVNFVKKPFHPIGKLGKLTFRFELPNGQLYDFKGVDHNMLMMVKYYVPRPTNHVAPPAVLNPNYQPDYLSYMIDHMRPIHDHGGEESSSVGDEELIREQNKYDYSSEEDSAEGEEEEFPYPYPIHGRRD